MNKEMIDVLKQEEKHRKQHPYWVWESIQSIPEMLAQCWGDDVRQDIESVIQECKIRKIERLVFLGRGSSYFAALSAKPFIQKITNLPVACYVSNVFEAYPYDKCDERTAVFFNSHSGKSEGDLRIVELVKSMGAYTVGVTDIADSSLAEAVDQLLIGPGGSKVELPATRTYATAIYRTLIFALAFGKSLGVAQDADGYETALKALPEQMRHFVPAFEQKAPEIVSTLKDSKSLIVVGSGPNFGNAEEAGMAFNQSSGIPTISYEMENYIHGPIQALNDQTGVILIATPSPLQGRMFSLASAAKTIGAKVVLITSEDSRDIPDIDGAVFLPAGIPGLFSPVATMVPLWQIGYHFGLLGNGSHPDRLSMDKEEFKAAFTHLMKSDKWVSMK